MKKMFILTGETSGDKLAASVIKELKKKNSEIEYLSVGGSYLKSIGINSIFDLKEITYIGFTSVLLNIFKIKEKINKTVDEIIRFNPDILFSVDSPDFTLRVAEKIKKINSKIKIIHYVAPQVWIWRKNRVKKFKKFVDHMLLLFKFEKKYFDRVKIPNTFVGHPLLENNDLTKIDISSLIKNKKNIISIFPGSRNSEVDTLMPILIKFISMMNQKFDNYDFFFHATNENKTTITEFLDKEKIINAQVISDENIKLKILSNSKFAVSKSGTISLEISNQGIASIIIYKINFINYLIMKSLVNVKFANIINIINDKEIIPELLQGECNSKEIFKTVVYFLKHPELMSKQIDLCKKTLKEIKSNSSSADEASDILAKYLIS
jgi:lipid-A-disaccharide synthase